MLNSNKTIVLASASPRRQELLKNAGIPFEVIITNADEKMDGDISPTEFVSAVSKRKAMAAVKICEKKQAVIIAADTVVCIEGKILGKPRDRNDAFEMLKLLENKWHGVYTGLTVAFIDDDGVEYAQDVCLTRVKFKALSDKEITEYIDTGDPFDKAGAYAIQGLGGKLIKEIDGDYNNVVGLPVNRLLNILNCREIY